MLEIVTSNRTYTIGQIAGAAGDAGDDLTVMGTVLADMDAADTATLVVTVSGSTLSVDIAGGTGIGFQGRLVQ